MSDETRPIIIRRKKVYAASGHHGGAWKVAYADFVTAMMAFFLLMWLLNATTEEQRKGIADYFNPNIPIAAVSGGGSKALNGDSIFAQKIMARDGIGASTSNPNEGRPNGDDDAKHNDTLKKVEALNQALKKKGHGLLEHVSFKKTDEGLVIELIDSNDEPLFDIGNASPSPLLEELLKVVSLSLGQIKNGVKIVGHTDARIFPMNAKYSNWELSSDRAHTARRLLAYYGFPATQIKEVSGKASTEPLVVDLMAAQNRRISIILMTREIDT